jgi:hypothetical protein
MAPAPSPEEAKFDIYSQFDVTEPVEIEEEEE